MELKDFIENFVAQLEDTNVAKINASTVFHELDEWSSMVALMIIGMIDEEYEVTVKADEMRNAVTIEDLYKIVKGKKA